MKGPRRVGSFKGGGGGRGGAPQPTDLLVCFPTRSRLTLMPKPICSPSRPTAHSSPRALFTTPANRTRSQLGSDPMSSEPTSPKVTCAGQIRVRSNSSSSKNRTVPKHSWIEALGLKKDVMSFLRSLRFNMQCFGSFRGAVDCCSDEDGDDDEEEEEEEEAGTSQARTVFSKWFMVLDENNGDDNEGGAEREKAYGEEEQEEKEEEAAQLPPKNALLLMRSRSAPTKGAEVEAEAKREEGGGDEERLVLMSYAPDFFKMSTDVAKETWVVGSADPLARCRSWRR